MVAATSKRETGLHDAVGQRLTNAGQRYTEGRRQLVSALATLARPVTVYDLLDQVLNMPQSSAYRHLTVLASTGVVRRLPGTDDSGFFELDDEVSGHHHHHHITCSVCGKVVDIASSDRLEKALDLAAEAAASETGFAIDGHRIDLVGTCADCQRRR